MTINLRPAIGSDHDSLLQWRNDPETRAASFNPDPVSPEAHKAWFIAALASQDRTIYIAENENRDKIGMVRIDRLGPVTAEININLAPAMRGKGLGTVMLEQASQEYEPGVGAVFFIARIKQENEASQKTFIKAGYHELFNYQDRKNGANIIVMGKLKK